MYKLPYFTEADPEKVISFMKENAFAVVTGVGDEYPVASHLPLNFETREEKMGGTAADPCARCCCDSLSSWRKRRDERDAAKHREDCIE